MKIPKQFITLPSVIFHHINQTRVNMNIDNKIYIFHVMKMILNQFTKILGEYLKINNMFRCNVIDIPYIE